ncbi:MAG TPA: hypothetical protein VIA29_02255 [Thermoanaerobaculia bacterium]|jgi:hypothetical protein
MQIGRGATRVAGDSLEIVRTVFRESLGLVHSTLTRTYHLEVETARDVEKELYRWFERFCQREGSPSPWECRDSLLVMACAYARERQRRRVETGEIEFREALDRTLRRDPIEIAREVSRPLRLLYHRLHEPLGTAAGQNPSPLGA